MIIGIGNDIVQVSRIKRVIERNSGDKFIGKVFTESEIAYCKRMSNPYPHFAVRWALKEAFYKALPEDLQSISFWKSVELVRVAGKRPELKIIDSKLSDRFSSEGIVISSSVSHEKEYATAVVTLEKR